MTSLIGLLALILVRVFWGGYVSATLWGWFMVPLGVAPITYWHAVGLSLLLSVFLGSRGMKNDKKESSTDSLINGFIYSVTIPAASIGIGWLAKINM